MSESWAQLEAEVWAQVAEHTSKIREQWSSAHDPQAAHCHCGQKNYPLQFFAEQLCEITFTKL